MEERLKQLTDRIKELNDKSTQILIFLSFAIIAAVALSSSLDHGSQKQIAVIQATRYWVEAIFPTAVVILPLKEFGWARPGWYHFIHWIKFVFAWTAVVLIALGAWKFLHAI